MFRVYEEYREDGKIVMYPNSDFPDSERDRANEYALDLRYDNPDLFSTSVLEVEPGTPWETITIGR